METDTPVIAKLNSFYANLSATEQKIAEFVLQNPDKVIYNSVTQIADELEVAQSTVTRFCKSIGLRGFQELKIKLARDMDGNTKSSIDVENMNLPQQLAQISIENLQETLKILDLQELQKAVVKIVQARKIVIYGLGESGPVAVLLKIRLMGLGLTVESHQDVHLQSISAAHLKPEDVAIGISQMGHTKDVVQSLDGARESGAHTICITAHGRSPITEVSDTRLVYLSKQISVWDKALKSKVSVLFVLELIVLSVSMCLHERKDRVEPEKTTESILDKLY
jgi:RpiR family carbohydrate utilization transcriptional regulator